jgi:hypothetical protein
MKITPQAEIWIGVIVALVSLFTGILTVTHPMTTWDQMAAYSAFSNVLFMAWLAWCGFQRLPKTGSSREI